LPTALDCLRYYVVIIGTLTPLQPTSDAVDSEVKACSWAQACCCVSTPLNRTEHGRTWLASRMDHVQGKLRCKAAVALLAPAKQGKCWHLSSGMRFLATCQPKMKIV
jgi:hypothetical protein